MAQVRLLKGESELTETVSETWFTVKMEGKGLDITPQFHQ